MAQAIMPDAQKPFYIKRAFLFVADLLSASLGVPLLRVVYHTLVVSLRAMSIQISRWWVPLALSSG